MRAVWSQLALATHVPSTPQHKSVTLQRT